jgi:hypothetical protein
MQRNPVRRGLVPTPQDWPRSSFRHYLTGEIGTVEIESHSTTWRREHPQAFAPPTLLKIRAGRPASWQREVKTKGAPSAKS